MTYRVHEPVRNPLLENVHWSVAMETFTREQAYIIDWNYLHQHWAYFTYIFMADAKSMNIL